MLVFQEIKTVLLKVELRSISDIGTEIPAERTVTRLRGFLSTGLCTFGRTSEQWSPGIMWAVGRSQCTA